MAWLPVLWAATAMAAPGRPAYRGPWSHDLARAEAEGRWGYLARDGRWAIAPQFDWAESFADGLAAVRRGERWGFIDPAGKVAIALQFEDVDDFSQGLAAVSDGKGWRYVDKAGKTIVDGSFLRAGRFRCGQAQVKVEQAFIVGTRPHGEYDRIGSEFVQSERDRDEALARSTDLEEKVGRRDQPAVDPAASTPLRELDDQAMALLYQLEDDEPDESVLANTSGPSWRAWQPQWEQQVWQTIDVHGTVLSAADIVPCPEPPAPGLVPSDLAPADHTAATVRKAAATLTKLHEMRDRMPAIRAFVSAGVAVLPALGKGLAAKHVKTRLSALEVLVHMGRLARPLLAEVARQLDGADKRQFVLAVWALGRLGEPGPQILHALCKQRRRSPGLVDAALRVFEPLSAASTDALEQGLDDAKRMLAFAWLLSRGKPRPELRERLLRIATAGLGDREPSNQELGVRILAESGAVAAPEVRTLLAKSLSSKMEGQTLVRVARQLLPVDVPAASEALVLAAASEAWEEALLLLGRQKDVPPSAIQALRRLHIKQTDCARLELLARVLWQLTRDAKLVLPLLLPKLEPADGNPDTFLLQMFPESCDVGALRVLAGMGPAAAAAKPQIRRYRGLHRELAAAADEALRAIAGAKRGSP